MSSSGRGFERDSIALRYVVEAAEAATVEALEGLFHDVPVRVEQSKVGAERPPDSSIASVITLSGHVSGLVSLYASRALAGHIGRALLDAEKAKELSDREVMDAFGELCNIIAGNIKTRCLAILDITIDIGIPAVIISRDGISVPAPKPDVAAAMVYAKVTFCPLTLYLCLTVSPSPRLPSAKLQPESNSGHPAFGFPAVSKAEFDLAFERIRKAGLEYGDSFDRDDNMQGPGIADGTHGETQSI